MLAKLVNHYNAEPIYINEDHVVHMMQDGEHVNISVVTGKTIQVDGTLGEVMTAFCAEPVFRATRWHIGATRDE
jgi:glutamate dehydrogenase/leucine dehydrogenase